MAFMIVLSWMLFYRAETMDRVYPYDRIGSRRIATRNYNEVEVYRHYNDMLKIYRENYKKTSDDEILSFLNEKYRERIKARETNIVIAYALFEEKMHYVENYYTNLDEKISASEKIVANSFYSYGSKGFLNVIKTRYDMMRAKDARVKVDNGKAVDAVMKEEISHFVMIIIALICVYGFLLERKKGLWELVHSGAGGRLRLVLKRIMVLSIVTTLAAIILYVGMYVISFGLYGGWKDVFNSIKCDSDYFVSELIVSRFRLMLIHFFVTVSVSITLGVLVWAILSMVNTQNIAVIIMTILASVEYLMYQNIDFKSRYSFFKDFNIFKIILPENILTKYKNVKIFSGIYGQLSVGCMSVMAILVIGLVLVLMVGCKKYPIGRKTFLQKVLEKVAESIRKRTYLVPNLCKELWKELSGKKAIYVIVIAFVFAVSARAKYSEILSETDIISKQFYDVATGLELSEELYDIRDGYYEERKELIEKMEQEADANSKNAYQIRLNELNYLISLADENIINLQNLRSRGINARVIKPYKIRELLGSRVDKIFENIDVVCILAVILISFSIYSYEKKQNNLKLIKSLQRGRGYYIGIKALTLFCMVLIIWLSVYGFMMYNLQKVYHFDNLGEYLQSYIPMSSFPVKMNIKKYMIILMLQRLMFMYGVSLLCFCISAVFDYYASLIVSLMILAPYILTIFGIGFLRVLSVTNIMNGNNYFMHLLYVMIGEIFVYVFFAGICTRKT